MDYWNVEAELRTSAATVQLVRFQLSGQVDNVVCEDDAYRLDLSLTPRVPNARMSFEQHWSPYRFERLGTVFLAPEGEALRARSDPGAQASIICDLRAERLRQWFDSDWQWSDRQREASLDIGSANIRDLLLRMGEEARHPGFASDVITEAMAMQMAVEIGRHFAVIGALPKAGGLPVWRLRLIDERLHEIGTPPTLGELAALCNISVRQLTRGFRASRGCSIGDHVATVRIDNAKHLLGAGRGVKEVAYTLGFSSPSSFCYAFRKATGTSPRQFGHRTISSC